MTANEMADKLELRLNKVNSFAAYGYEDVEISSFLNSAQSLYIQEFVDELNNRKGQGFEEGELRTLGFSNLIESTVLPVSANQLGKFPNGVCYNTPTTSLGFIHESPTSNKTVCGSEEFIIPTVVVVSHDEYARWIRNSYRRPYINEYDGVVWRMYLNNKRVQLITDGSYNITSYFVKYLRPPVPITVDRVTPSNQVNCELGYAIGTGINPVHETIIDIAIRLIDNSNLEQRPPLTPNGEQLN